MLGNVLNKPGKVGLQCTRAPDACLVQLSSCNPNTESYTKPYSNSPTATAFANKHINVKC